jgi:hypothetical protein
MGTRVPETGPPQAPEPLLPAPALRDAEVSWNYSNGLLHWSHIDMAAAYVVEICANQDCTAPLQRHTVAAPDTRLQVEPLPHGPSWWRVHAVSANELDGYPSAAGRIDVTDPTPDLEAPMLALVPVSGFVQGGR